MTVGVLARLGIVGAGNVGSALLMEAARDNVSSSISIVAREPGAAVAAILDAASAFPQSARTMSAGSRLEGRFDVVVVTAGVQPTLNTTREQLADANCDVALRALASRDLDVSVVVLVGSPVDLVTERVTRDQAGRKWGRVIGFGGELDRARLRYALDLRGLQSSGDATVVGEHGLHCVPVYSPESDYEKVTAEVRGGLSRIKAATGRARNLASGVQLVQLLRALAGEDSIQCVSLPHNEYGLCLTWPHNIGRGGAVGRCEVPQMGPQAWSLLEALLAKRRGGL